MVRRVAPMVIRKWITSLTINLGKVGRWELAGTLDYCPFDEGLVVKKGDRVVGAVTLAPSRIVGLFTLPQFRRQGIGRSLLLAAVKRCRERGFDRVVLEICDQRANALVTRIFKERPRLREYLEVHEAYPYD